MNVHNYLEERQELIDRALDRYLKECSRQPRNLSKAMRYSVFSGGKRLRPILTMAVGELFGAKRRILIPFACAVEMVHAYSLVHDDLPVLDNDDFRRGKPTAHKLFGEGIALLTGDALLSEAFHLMTLPQVVRTLEPKLILGLIGELSHAAGISGLAGGQAADLEAEGREMNVATIEYIHVRKTGALILAAARSGARIGGAKAKAVTKISRYAEFLGLAFQIKDDLLDAEDPPCGEREIAVSAKEQRKATYPSVVGSASAKARAEELLQRCLKEIELFGKRAEPLREIAHYIIERNV
tara:strand:- start:45 stop:935 length:891 start_codon:yes stop_codon:yes gene_type:complete